MRAFCIFEPLNYDPPDLASRSTAACGFDDTSARSSLDFPQR